MNAQNEKNPVRIVQSIYEAFGRGDVPFILSQLSPDVEWEYGYSDNEVPWLRKRRGPAGVADFFGAVGGNLQFHNFAPTDLLAGKDKVVALVTIDATVTRTGIRVTEVDEVHIWHFDQHGRVCRFRHVVDTLQHQRAWLGA